MRQLKFSFFLLLIIAISSCSTNQNEKAEAKSESKPNFIFVIADDQTFESINTLNNPEIVTPNLDKLSQMGTSFTHCFNEGAWGGAVCVASRAMINSGRRLWNARTGINTDSLWGEVFKNSGYQTVLSGKWHNGGKTALKSFTEIDGLGRGMYETKQGMKGPRYRRIDRKVWHPTDTSWGGQWKPSIRNGIRTDTSYTLSDPIRIDQHATEYFTDRALDFLQKRKEGDDPYLLYVSYTAPHDPKQVTQEYLDMYPVDSMKLPVNYIDEHPFDQGHHAIRDEIIAPLPRTERSIKVHRSEYYAFITHTDEQVGRIIDAWKKTPDWENTYLVFTADHGLAVGMHGLMGKQNMYDHSVRMPFIIAGPDIEAGSVNNEMIYMQSIYPTTAQLAGIKVPETVEFPSIVDLLQNKGKGQEYIYGGYMHFQRMVRSKTHKLILYPHNQKYQLFDIENDPYETKDISEGNEDIMNSLYQELIELQKVNGDTMEVGKFWETSL